MKEIHKHFCAFGQHMTRPMQAVVSYPPEVGGLDIYKYARVCVHCGRKEIFAPIERIWMVMNEFDLKYNAVTILKED